MTFELNSPLEALLVCLLTAALPAALVVLTFLAARNKIRISRQARAELQSDTYLKYFRGANKRAFRQAIKFTVLAICVVASLGVLAGLWIIWNRADFENWPLIALVLISLPLGALTAAITLRFTVRNLTDGDDQQGEDST